MRQGGLLFNATRVGLLAALLAVFLPVTFAHANTRLCRQLEAQLASVPSGGGSSAQAKRYDAAIVRQQEQLQKARDEGRKAGCGRSMSGSAVAFCANLNATMERMQGNLADLKRKRTQMGGGGTRERSRILAAIDVNGCRAPERRLPPAVEAAPRQEIVRQRENRGQIVIDGRTGTQIGQLTGRYRTMCVRSCDGYYFPISNSVPQSGFARDQQACESMCPGTRVELHYHRLQGEESEDMVSAVTGLPYREMENAFLYRKQNASSPAGCGCGASAAPRGFEVIGGDYGSGIVDDDPAQDQDEPPPIPQPSGRPDPAEDPETLASREGGLDADTIKRLATPTRSGPPDPAMGDADRPVRVVGPQFLPGPEEAIDLRAQDPARAQ
ncbi:DUF2865 domain-containing protein [Mesorhizobium sp. CAU 1741]|uniref:DUF2865 domain-containing protein n=1 Tax=Mesorhizobium sp. CAU 1741 TaxID=3140366 RepID=UPI00325AE6CE